MRAEGARRRGGLRGPRRRRQGRRDQAGHASTSTPASPGSSRCRRRPSGERTQWYFQRYVEHLPGRRRDRAVRPQLVQPRRRRAGDGLLHAGGAPALPAPVPDLRAAAGRGRHPAAQVLVLGQRRGAGAPVPAAARRTRCGAGSCRRWTWSRSPAGRTTPGPRTRCSSTPTSPRRPGTSSRATTSAAARINMIAHLLSTIPYHEVAAADAGAAAPAGSDRLRPDRALAADTRCPTTPPRWR